MYYFFSKDSASRAQSSWLGIAEAKPVLCKDSASRAQSSWLGIAEAKPVLCKGTLNVRMRKINKNFFSRCTRLFHLTMAYLVAVNNIEEINNEIKKTRKRAGYMKKPQNAGVLTKTAKRNAL